MIITQGSKSYEVLEVLELTGRGAVHIITALKQDFKVGYHVELDGIPHFIRGIESFAIREYSHAMPIGLMLEERQTIHAYDGTIVEGFSNTFCGSRGLNVAYVHPDTLKNLPAGPWAKRICKECYRVLWEKHWTTLMEAPKIQARQAKHRAVHVLNQLFAREPQVIKKWLSERFMVGPWVVDHPTLVPGLIKGCKAVAPDALGRSCEARPNQYDLGLIGLLNGLFCNADGGEDLERIAYEVDDVTMEITGFSVQTIQRVTPITTIAYKAEMDTYADDWADTKESPLYITILRKNNAYPLEWESGKMLRRRMIAGERFYFPCSPMPGEPGIPWEAIKDTDWFKPIERSYGLYKFKQEYPEDDSHCFETEASNDEQDHEPQ